MLRKEKKEKQDVPAKALDMGQSNFSHIENAKTPLSIGQLKIFCDEMGKDIIDVIKMAQRLP